MGKTGAALTDVDRLLLGLLDSLVVHVDSLRQKFSKSSVRTSKSSEAGTTDRRVSASSYFRVKHVPVFRRRRFSHSSRLLEIRRRRSIVLPSRLRQPRPQSSSHRRYSHLLARRSHDRQTRKSRLDSIRRFCALQDWRNAVQRFETGVGDQVHSACLPAGESGDSC